MPSPPGAGLPSSAKETGVRLPAGKTSSEYPCTDGAPPESTVL